MILLDTHVVVWLYAGAAERLSPAAIQRIEFDEVAVSPAVELELAYLHEIGRVTRTPAEIVGDLASRIGLQVAQIPFALVCSEAVSLNWTRDPFDRMQAAHAIARQLPLLTKDGLILQNLPLAFWD